MALLAALFFCCMPGDAQKRKPSNNDNPDPSYHAQPYQGHDQMNHHPFQPFIDEDDPFHSSQPLPRYTERPMSIREKTLVFSGRRSIADDPAPRDEKNLNVSQPTFRPHSPPQSQSQAHESTSNGSDDRFSDASSTFSLPSSFGNTSTATAETLPPAYSVISSRAPSQRSMSISISVHEMGTIRDDLLPASSPPPLVLPPPAALGQGHDSRHIPRRASITHRTSRDSRRRTPSLPPTYSRS